MLQSHPENDNDCKATFFTQCNYTPFHCWKQNNFLSWIMENIWLFWWFSSVTEWFCLPEKYISIWPSPCGLLKKKLLIQISLFWWIVADTCCYQITIISVKDVHHLSAFVMSYHFPNLSFCSYLHIFLYHNLINMTTRKMSLL